MSAILEAISSQGPVKAVPKKTSRRNNRLVPQPIEKLPITKVFASSKLDRIFRLLMQDPEILAGYRRFTTELVVSGKRISLEERERYCHTWIRAISDCAVQRAPQNQEIIRIFGTDDYLKQLVQVTYKPLGFKDQHLHAAYASYLPNLLDVMYEGRLVEDGTLAPKKFLSPEDSEGRRLYRDQCNDVLLFAQTIAIAAIAFSCGMTRTLVPCAAKTTAKPTVKLYQVEYAIEGGRKWLMPTVIRLENV